MLFYFTHFLNFLFMFLKNTYVSKYLFLSYLVSYLQSS